MNRYGRRARVSLLSNTNLPFLLRDAVSVRRSAASDGSARASATNEYMAEFPLDSKTLPANLPPVPAITRAGPPVIPASLTPATRPTFLIASPPRKVNSTASEAAPAAVPARSAIPKDNSSLNILSMS